MTRKELTQDMAMIRSDRIQQGSITYAVHLNLIKGDGFTGQVEVNFRCNEGQSGDLFMD